MIYRLFALGLAVLMLTQAVRAEDSNIRKELDALVASLDERFNAKDAAGIGALHTQNVIYLTQSAKRVGSQAITQRYDAIFKAGYNHVETSLSQVTALSDDIVFIIGDSTATGQDGIRPLASDFSAVIVRMAGTWKIRLFTSVPKAQSTSATSK